MPAFFLIPFVKKAMVIIGIVLFLGISFGLYSCKEERKGKALIKHNNEKRDSDVENSVEKAENFSEERKIENQKKTTIRIYRRLYADKVCVAKVLAECSGKEIKDVPFDTHSKECKDKALKRCYKKIEGPSKEEAEKLKREALIKMKGNVAQ